MQEFRPLCSIIVLNYFGEKILAKTINSLLDLNYPKEKFEIIIIDNNSKDKSPEIILDYSKKVSNIKYKFLDKNKGFAGGNNEGIKIAKGNYVILLNNDCIVNKNWLKELVKTAIKDSKIFAVSSKIKLYPKFYYLKFNYNSNLFLVSTYIQGSHLLENIKPNRSNLNILIREKFFILEVPFSHDDRNITIEMNFEIEKKNFVKNFDELFSLISQDGIINNSLKWKSKKGKMTVYLQLNTTKFNKKNVYERIQNAGIVVFQDGAGRDKGAKIIEQRQYYEYDLGQYSEEQEVYAACGAAVLYNKKILNKIGYLDELFFMYYEDVEISERARLRGYKIYYSPKAEVRHLHAFSSNEWSNFFIFQAEKGRFLHMFFNFPFRIFMKEYFIMVLRICEIAFIVLLNLSDWRRVFKYIVKLLTHFKKTSEKKEYNQTDFGKVFQLIKILLYFLINFPILLIIKYFKLKKIIPQAIENNYEEIIEGRWYIS